MGKKKPKSSKAVHIDQANSMLGAIFGNDPSLGGLKQQFSQLLDEMKGVAEDPLGILGKPNPTAAERKVIEALAREMHRPPKLCRQALLKSGNDVTAAKKLLNDLDYCRKRVEYPIDLGSRFRNPFLARIEYLRIEAPYLGRTEADIAPEIAKLQKQADRYDKQREKIKTEGGVKKKLKDPVFGDLKWDEFFWIGRVTVPEFGKMSLTVDTGGDDSLRKAPDEKQRAAFNAFLASARKIRTAVAEANLKYLKRVRKSYEESAMPVPKAETGEQLWKHLTDAALTIPPQRGASWKVELTWNCTWDEEHGHLVGIRDGKVAYVGLQGDGW